MKLHCFIDEHIEDILLDFESFARQIDPAGRMCIDALRDDAMGILKAIALDIETRQNPEQQSRKSRGLGRGEDGKSSASVHGAQRHSHDFSLAQVVSEYRALRASVLRLWLPHVGEMTVDTVYEVTRFNESVDQALAESAGAYSTRAEDARELFLAILGHDLRNPLASMMMAGEVLAHPQLPHDQVQSNGARVLRAARLMSSMVNDLIGYTRTQLGGGMPTVLLPVDVAEVCQSAVEDAGACYPGNSFRLDMAGNLKGAFDSVRLHQLFTNLLVNAAQHGAKSSPVVIAAWDDADVITVEVRNQGPVIPEASLQSIFKPLIQLPAEASGETRSGTSLGLGLFVAREIAIAHGGAIAVTSSEADGTIFRASLPRGSVKK